MGLERQPVPRVLAWSNQVSLWWTLLTLVSLLNIIVWLVLYAKLRGAPGEAFAGKLGIDFMFMLSAAYVFGCAFRSFLPRADVQRICLFDTWLSSVVIGRSVATVAEMCFAAQWVIVLHRLGTITGADSTVAVAWAILPLILIAECFSWYAVLTRNYFGNAIENSIWAITFFMIAFALCRLLPEFGLPVSAMLAMAVVGIAGYLAFLVSVDVPTYVSRWRADIEQGNRSLTLIEGLREVSTRWIVRRDLSEWKDEIVWMSLYFSAAVWASLAVCVFFSFEHDLWRYRVSFE